ncbi:hypothetical protein PS15m_004542 [Mucor circinelloides]
MKRYRVPLPYFYHNLMTENNFQSSFDNKIRDKLYMKDFWTSEPCDWTITNYLSKLIAQDPALTRRSASNKRVYRG